jgi:hypothetical protein
MCLMRFQVLTGCSNRRLYSPSTVTFPRFREVIRVEIKISRAGHEAIDAILDLAPAFLEPEIRNLVKRRGHERFFAHLAAEALAEIDTHQMDRRPVPSPGSR